MVGCTWTHEEKAHKDQYGSILDLIWADVPVGAHMGPGQSHEVRETSLGINIFEKGLLFVENN